MAVPSLKKESPFPTGTIELKLQNEETKLSKSVNESFDIFPLNGESEDCLERGCWFVECDTEEGTETMEFVQPERSIIRQSENVFFIRSPVIQKRGVTSSSFPKVNNSL